MSVPTWARSTNITLSIQRRIGNSITVAGVTYPIYYGMMGDPDARDTNSEDEEAWVQVLWLQESAGGKGQHLLSIDVYSKTGPIGGGGDPMGITCRRIADAVEDIFRWPNAAFRIYDYAALGAPVETNVCVQCQNTRGTPGVVESKQTIPFDRTLNRVNLTFRFITAVDAMWGPSFATS
jgi:hypothetical protein